MRLIASKMFCKGYKIGVRVRGGQRDEFMWVNKGSSYIGQLLSMSPIVRDVARGGWWGMCLKVAIHLRQLPVWPRSIPSHRLPHTHIYFIEGGREISRYQIPL